MNQATRRLGIDTVLNEIILAIIWESLESIWEGLGFPPTKHHRSGVLIRGWLLVHWAGEPQTQSIKSLYCHRPFSTAVASLGDFWVLLKDLCFPHWLPWTSLPTLSAWAATSAWQFFLNIIIDIINPSMLPIVRCGARLAGGERESFEPGDLFGGSSATIQTSWNCHQYSTILQWTILPSFNTPSEDHQQICCTSSLVPFGVAGRSYQIQSDWLQTLTASS